MNDMVTIGGVRYRLEDAERKGLIKKVEVEVKKAPAPANKKRTVSTLSTKGSVESKDDEE